MGKIIRPKYPIEYSLGIIVLIGTVAGFLSPQIFNTRQMVDGTNIYLGMFLASLAVIIMVLIIWEEILFPVKLKEVNGSMFFGNHRTKLQVQALIYCSIPIIFCFIYLEYKVNHVRFFIWAAVCTIAPVVEKIVSGINNYNDFLKLSNETVQYKNNEKEGNIAVEDIQYMSIIKDNRKVVQKLQLFFKNEESLIIDLDEMELEAFYEAIEKYLLAHYPNLIK